MHMPGAQGLKSMHPAAKMCTPGAGCTLNFEHCIGSRNNAPGSLTKCSSELIGLSVFEIKGAPCMHILLLRIDSSQ